MAREADKLKELIKKAIEDSVVTSKEYHEILSQAGADGHEDPEERTLLANLQEMIANGSIKRTA
jgi:hypothetical protein